MAGSNGYNFTAGTKARANEVNSNFEWFRGHYLPVTQSSTWANTSGVYDLGSSALRWRAVYLADTSTAFNGASNAITNDNLSRTSGKRIQQITVTTPTNTVSFTGLTGETDIFYRLYIGGHAFLGGASTMRLYFNQDSTTSYFDSKGQSLNGIQLLFSSAPATATSGWNCESLIFAKAIPGFRAHSIHGRAMSMGNFTSTFHDFGGCWSNATAEITSIQIQGDTTTATFNTGTVIELYSLG